MHRNRNAGRGPEARWAEMWETIGDCIVDVLADDDTDLSTTSREQLEGAARIANGSAAQWAEIAEKFVVCTRPGATSALSPGRRSRDEARVAGELMRGPDGISSLNIDSATFNALNRADILTVGAIARRFEDGTILAVPGIGPKRAEALRASIERWEARR